MNKTELVETLLDYINNNKDILMSKQPKFVITLENKMIEQTAEHLGILLFKLLGENVVYNPHRFNDQRVKELSLLLPECNLVPAVLKGDLMFWTGLETI